MTEYLERTGAPRMAYETRGRGGPWVTLIHSLGCSRAMWSRQLDALAGSFRVLAYDLRGHGESAADDTAGSLGLLAGDLLDLKDALGIERTHLVGLSIGGMIAQTVALSAPRRVASLVLANTTCAMPEPARDAWLQRIEQVRREGVASLAEPSMRRWLAPAVHQEQPGLFADLVAQFSRTSAQGYICGAEAVRAVDTQGELPRLACPTLVIAGADDAAVPPEASRAMCARIPGAELVMLEGAGHLSNLEQPLMFNAALLRFLSRHADTATSEC